MIWFFLISEVDIAAKLMTFKTIQVRRSVPPRQEVEEQHMEIRSLKRNQKDQKYCKSHQ